MRWRVPQDWRWTTVGAIADVVGGGTPTASDPANFNEAGVPWITPADLSGYSGTYIERGARSLSQRGYERSGARLMPPRALLFSSRAPIGYCVIARKSVATNQGFKSLILKDGVLPEYVRHYLLGSKQYIEDLASGTTFKEISGRRMAEVEVPVAPLEEQHRIVAAIETHFSRLDAAVASLTRAKANVKRARASVLKAAVEGRLVPTEAALARAEGRDYEPAAVLLDRILAERKAAWAASGARGKYKEPVKPETEGLPGLPAGWCWAGMDAVTLVSGGITKNAGRARRDQLVPYLRVANVYADDLRLHDVASITVSDAELTRLLLQRGDLLIVEGNGSADQLGRVAVWNGSISPCIHQNHLIKARPLRGVSERWLLHWMLSPGGRRAIQSVASSTSGLHTLSISKVQALPVMIPPLAEQHRIVAEVDRRLSVLDALDATLHANLARCARLRQSILKRAFEGRLVPAEADAPLLAAEPPMPPFAQDASS